MADETPESSESPVTDKPVALDQAPLSEFIARRDKGETQTQPAAAPEKVVSAESAEKEPVSPEGDEEAPAEKEKKPPVQAGKPKTRFEERLGTLTRQRHDAERALESEKQRAAKLEAELNELRRSKEPDKAPLPAPDGQPPNLDQYLAAGKTYEDWSNANTQFIVQRAILQDRQQQAMAAQQRAIDESLQSYPQRLEAAQQKYADFDDVVLANDRVTLSPVMQAVALHSPHGADIMYWLGTHETEANQLGAQTQGYPIAETFRFVEHHLMLLSGQSPNSNNGQAGAKKAVPVSQAPAPITPVGGGTTTQPLPLDQLPLGEYIKRREQQQKKKVG